MSALFLMENVIRERTRVCMQCNTVEALPGWKVSQTSFVILVTLNWEKMHQAVLYAAIKMAETWCSWAWKHAPGGVCVFSHDSSAGGALLSGFHFPQKNERPSGPSPSASPSDGEIFKWCCASSALTQILTAMRKSKCLMNYKRKRKALFSELNSLLLYKLLNIWYKARLYFIAEDFFFLPFVSKRQQ